jgi:predicted nucleotidyltransferase
MRTINYSLSDALFTRVQQRVLSVLFGHPDRTYFVNELIRLAGVGVGAVTRELAKLVSAGLVTVSWTGNQKHYQANKASPIFAELRGIVLKTFGVADILHQALVPFSDHIKTAFIYGSVAKGEDTAKSDIDLLVLSDNLAYPDLFAVLTEAEKQLGRPVKPTIYTTEELDRRLASGNEFISRILDLPKIFIIGSESDIRESGQSRQNQAAET